MPSAGAAALVDEVAVVAPVPGVGVLLCAQLDTETASISAPKGSRALSEEGGGVCVIAAARGGKLSAPPRRDFLLRAERAEGCAKRASKRDPALSATDLVSGNSLAVLEAVI